MDLFDFARDRDATLEELKEKQKRLDGQAAAFRLVHDYYLKGGRRIIRSPGVITEVLVNTLKNSTARLWLLKDGEYVCVDQYDAYVRYHPDAGDTPDCLLKFFHQKKLGYDQYIVPDVLKAGMPSDLEAYYDSHGIRSLMFSPICITETLGFLTAADYSPREWLAEEQTFAMSLSNFVALCLSRQVLEEKQAQLNSLFSNLPGAAFQMRYCQEGAVFDFLSERGKSIIGFSQEEAENRTGILKEYIYPDDFETFHAEHNAARMVGDTLELLYRSRINDSIRWLLEKSKVIEVDRERGTCTYEGFTLDVTERVRLREIEIESEKNNCFLDAKSREIKAPLISLIGFGHLLARTNLNEMQADYLLKVQSASNSVLTIVNSILDSSLAGTGKREPDGEC